VADVILLRQTTARAGPEESRRLRLDPSRFVMRVERTRKGDQGPLSYEVLTIAIDHLPGLDPHEKMTSDIQDLVRRHGISLGMAREQVSFITANPSVALTLGTRKNARLLRIERLVETAGGIPLEWRILLTPSRK
jgi:GntR family transcriptional regulator